MITSQLSEFELHHVAAKLAMMYESTIEYSELQLSTKHDCLHVINPRNSKTIAKEVPVYKAALDGFAI